MRRLLAVLLILTLFAPAVMAEEEAVLTVLLTAPAPAEQEVFDWAQGEMRDRYGVTVEYVYATSDDNLVREWTREKPTLAYLNEWSRQALVGEGALYDLSEAAAAREWIEKSTPGALEFANARTPGFLYGVPVTTSPVVVYYNRDIFADIGAEKPRTYEEMQWILEDARRAGYVPMELGGRTMRGALWSLFCLVYTRCGMADVNRFYYEGEATDGLIEALLFGAKALEDWAQSGYLREGVQGVSEETALQSFCAGESAMLVTGDWDTREIAESEVSASAFCFPTANEDNPLYIVNQARYAWAVAAGADEDRLYEAERFIDLFFTEEAARTLAGAGLTPLFACDIEEYAAYDLQLDVLEAVAGAGNGYFLDGAIPGFYYVMTGLTQRLIAGQLDGEEYVNQILDEYYAFAANN